MSFAKAIAFAIAIAMSFNIGGAKGFYIVIANQHTLRWGQWWCLATALPLANR